MGPYVVPRKWVLERVLAPGEQVPLELAALTPEEGVEHRVYFIRPTGVDNILIQPQLDEAPLWTTYLGDLKKDGELHGEGIVVRRGQRFTLFVKNPNPFSAYLKVVFEGVKFYVDRWERDGKPKILVRGVSLSG